MYDKKNNRDKNVIANNNEYGKKLEYCYIIYYYNNTVNVFHSI